jgi:hypothetical protein
MVKSKFFPLSDQDENHLFQDPDEHFRSLPYYDEIPDLSPHGSRVPPLPVNLRPFISARERVGISATFGLITGVVFSHAVICPLLHGPVTPRNKKWPSHLFCGVLFGLSSAVFQLVLDPACSPYLTGRSAPLFEQEAMRHALDAKYDLYASLDRVMHSKTRITKQQFYNSYTQARLRD